MLLKKHISFLQIYDISKTFIKKLPTLLFLEIPTTITIVNNKVLFRNVYFIFHTVSSPQIFRIFSRNGFLSLLIVPFQKDFVF